MSYANELSRRLAAQAEAVCRAYLPAGRRNGRYWIAGDAQGTKGKSLFVKLFGDGAGRWTDAASGEYGDLLDLIRLNKGLDDVREALHEARYFLRDPQPIRNHRKPSVHTGRPLREPPRDTLAAAGKLRRFSRPVPHTLAETYLRGRAITASLYLPALRFHPACYYRPGDGGPRQSWPALLGVVTDLDGNLTGLQRTWLARDGSNKAPLPDPRRAMGHLLGNAVRFGKPKDVMAAGEGIETVLSLLSLFPALPMAAGLSAAHLAAIRFPPGLRRLYVLRDNDAAGDFAEDRLAGRCREAGIECRVLRPRAKDLNADLRADPAHAVKARMIRQFAPDDRSRFRP
jgi:Toprim domain